MSFRPLGEKIHSYTRVLRDRASATPNADKEREDDGGAQEVEFEVYHVRLRLPSSVSISVPVSISILTRLLAPQLTLDEQCTWDTPGFREYHRRMQLFILLYIEGGSYVNETEEGWEFAVLCVPPPPPLWCGALTAGLVCTILRRM